MNEEVCIFELNHIYISLQWRHNGCDGVSNHQPLDCLLKCLFMRRSKKTSKLRVTGLCAWNSPVTGEFPEQMASNTKIVSIWWRHHYHQTKALSIPNNTKWHISPTIIYNVKIGNIPHLCPTILTGTFLVFFDNIVVQNTETRARHSLFVFCKISQ